MCSDFTESIESFCYESCCDPVYVIKPEDCTSDVDVKSSVISYLCAGPFD